MGDAAVVRVGHGPRDAFHHAEETPRAPTAREEPREALALQSAHRQVGPPLLADPHRVDRHDARMLELSAHLGLGHEPIDGLRVDGPIGRQDPERHVTAHAPIVGVEEDLLQRGLDKFRTRRGDVAAR